MQVSQNSGGEGRSDRLSALSEQARRWRKGEGVCGALKKATKKPANCAGQENSLAQFPAVFDDRTDEYPGISRVDHDHRIIIV